MSSNDRNENPDNHDQEGTAKNSFFEKRADKTQDREANTGTEHEQKKSCEWPQNRGKDGLEEERSKIEPLMN